jgi:hypothetical protein
MLPLFPADAIRPAQSSREAARAEASTFAPAVNEEPTEVVNLRRACTVNGEPFGPGRYVVSASLAATLRALDAGR